MKKIIAVLLSVLMIAGTFSVAVGAESVEQHEKCPIIFIAGSSVELFDEEGNEVSDGIGAFTDRAEGEEGLTTEDIIETTLRILLPFFIEGIAEDEWDNYGDALYEEFAPLWDKIQLDGDGNTKYGVGPSPEEIEMWDKRAETVDTGADGFFGINDYKFRYDYRLSPYEHADRLHEFIKKIIITTGCSQVALVGRCLGGNVINAYLDVYGSEGLVKKVVYDEVMSNGSSVINDCFTGRIDISDKHAQAYVLASSHYGKRNVGIDISTVNDLVVEMVERTLDLLTQLGATDAILDEIEDLYSRLYEAFMPAMLKATGLATWPSYWAAIYDENIDAALDFLFGEEGSEEREANAGLIEKILYIRENITKPRELEGDENLYKIFEKEYGVGIAVVAGYGLPIPPLGVNHDDNGDITVDTRSASLGGTVAGLFDTLDQDYIDERIAAGYGDYISPDGKIDASTCIFPETTWFVKNKFHDTGNFWWRLAEYYTQYTNVTASSNERNYSRFIVSSISDDSAFANMTTENMADAPWIELIEEEPTEVSQIAAAIRFLTTLIKILTQIINGVFSLTK